MRTFRFSLSLFLVFGLATAVCRGADIELQEGIVYSKFGDRELKLDVYLPSAEGNRPAILVVHGGAWRMGDRKQLRSYAEALTRRGFVCFAIDYRLAPKYKFPAQIDDCRSAVKWIRSHAKKYNVDPRRLGAIGYSAGGHLVALLGTTGKAPSKENGQADTRIQAVAAGGAPTDFRTFDDNGKWAEYLMGGDLDTAKENFLAASATAFVDKDDAPTFFFNGNKDTLVPLDWTQSCYQALKKCGVRTELYIVEGAGHIEAALNREALAKACDFLVRELKPEAKDPQGVSSSLSERPHAEGNNQH